MVSDTYTCGEHTGEVERKMEECLENKKCSEVLGTDCEKPVKKIYSITPMLGRKKGFWND